MRKLLTLIIVLALLAVAADRLAWYIAERGVAQAIQDSENLAQRPDVHIGGVPFLTQAWSGRYEDVDVTFQDVPAAEGVTVSRLDARLNGVHVPLEDIIDRSVTSAPVDQASATGLVGFEALNSATARQLSASEIDVTYGPGAEPDRLAVTGTYDGPAGELELTGESRLEVQDGALVVTVVPESLNLPPVVRDTVARLLGITYEIPELPFGFRVADIQVAPDGVAVTAEAEDVVLGPVENAS